MGNKILLSLCILLLLAATINTQSGILNQKKFHISLDENSNYLLDWSYDASQEIMQFTVRVKTTGWVGFGISPYTGKMPGSDIVIGWVDKNGKAHLKDRFATSRSLPSIDASQDYRLVSGREENGTTTLTFWRKFNTGDPHDLPLETGTSRIIWAYNRMDPESETDIPFHEKMGTRSVNLFERMSENDKPKLPPDTKAYDILVPNVTVPTSPTTYWCVALKLPPVTEKHHIVKLAPIVKKGNEGVVHHMLLYECESDDKWHGYSADCSSRNMPIHLRRCRGSTIVVAWAVGGEDITFPQHAGYPIGGAHDSKFVYLEMHYDNPEQRSDIVDASGLQIYYTKQLRENDIGILSLGHLLSPMLMIPEGQNYWNITGYCPQLCTERVLPKLGLNMFGIFLHTHLAGIALSARHFRNGKELPVIADNRHYDFNYQEVLHLKDEVKLMPGDSIAFTCSYRTLNRKNVTVAGLETSDEMCFGYLFYYPRIPFSYCISTTGYDTLTPFYTKLTEQGKMPVPTETGLNGMSEALKQTKIGDQGLIDELHKLQTYSSPLMICGYSNHTSVTGDYNTKIANFKPVVNYTRDDAYNHAVSLSSANLITMLIYAMFIICLIS